MVHGDKNQVKKWDFKTSYGQTACTKAKAGRASLFGCKTLINLILYSVYPVLKSHLSAWLMGEEEAEELLPNGDIQDKGTTSSPCIAYM